jgi:hypothetical protein
MPVDWTCSGIIRVRIIPNVRMFSTAAIVVPQLLGCGDGRVLHGSGDAIERA